MNVRLEQVADEAVISDLTARAFAPMPYADGTESAVIDRLRTDGDLTLSLVAGLSGVIVGHVAFSPVTIDGRHADWFALGPVSVEPEHQRNGIGSALIRQGLDLLRERGAAGCVLLGDPGYYHRFGFQSDGHLTYREVDPKHVQWLAFGSQSARGLLEFAPAFDQTV